MSDEDEGALTIGDIAERVKTERVIHYRGFTIEYVGECPLVAPVEGS